MSDKVQPMDNSQMQEGKGSHPDADKDVINTLFIQSFIIKCCRVID